MTNTLEERVAQAIAFSLAASTDLPDWLQTPALGRNMLPLGELAAPTVVAVVGEVLDDLRDRLVTGACTLGAFENAASQTDYAIRCAKAEGVRLAPSYLDEAVREAGR